MVREPAPLERTLNLKRYMSIKKSYFTAPNILERIPVHIFPKTYNTE